MNVRLFIKPGCPWCEEALEWLNDQGVEFQTLDIIQDSDAREEMIELTGQSKVPSIEVDGALLADFGAEELEAWWLDQGFATE